MKKEKFIYALIMLQFLIYNLALAQNVAPVKGVGSKYSFRFANLYFEVDAAIGGRICSFQIDSTEILIYNAARLLQSGSTFWPSPQSVWKWPPYAVLDRNPYSVSILNNELTLTSDITSGNLRVLKIFSANSQDSSMSIKYIMKNEGTTAISWAPWEITRVKASGITFFGKGDGSVTGNMAANTSESKGIVWYDQNITKPSATINKFFCDGKGWLAHVCLDNILFIKKFTDISPATAAPEESEIEVYTEPTNLFTELENQGAYVTINQQDSVIWEVKWFARKLPKKIPAAIGSGELVDFTNKIINSNNKSNSTSGKNQKLKQH
jgi:hypothetical protein